MVETKTEEVKQGEEESKTKEKEEKQGAYDKGGSREKRRGIGSRRTRRIRKGRNNTNSFGTNILPGAEFVLSQL